MYEGCERKKCIPRTRYSLNFKNNLTIHKVSSVLLFTHLCARIHFSLLYYYDNIIVPYSNISRVITAYL